MRIPHIPFSEILHFTEVIAIVGTTLFAALQLRALRLQNSADLALRLDQQLNTDVNENLENDLDSDPRTPILKEHGGKYTVIQLDNFLSQYETLDDLYQNGLITCRMMYNEFSGDLEDAYKNKDVMAQVAEERKDDPSTWEGFIHLGKKFDKNYRCQ